jgi:hypothetical protein
LGKGCSDNKEMQVFPVGASVECELHLIMDSIVSYPIQCIVFLVLFLFVLFFKGKSRGHCPVVVTRGNNVTHKHFMEMRILACDETPFLLDMPPRATSLVW